MMSIKYDANTMEFMSLFETLTRASVKDCFESDGQLVFIVNKGEIGKAIGKKAVNVKKLEGLLKKKIKIIEFSDEMLEFVKNIVQPCKVKDIAEEEGSVTITAEDSYNRGLLIGRAAVNLRGYEKIVKRFFPIKELKVN